MCVVPKSTSLNLRITQEFRDDLQKLADYRGLTLSSLAHSILVKGLRSEKQNEPEAFKSERGENASVDRVEETRGRIAVVRHEGELTDDQDQTRKTDRRATAKSKRPAKAAK